MNRNPILSVVFFKTDVGHAPVQQWLREFDKTTRKAIGEDIRLVQFRWPLGMPLVRKWKRIYGKFAVVSAEDVLLGFFLQLEIAR